ncbi:hypothetical protein BX600DRAFT_472814 [Xylariales sp. PMI_506]|nr:hypothetical protein BX600DRAFT_472814 [Xylariales sp. PMI_506]
MAGLSGVCLRIRHATVIRSLVSVLGVMSSFVQRCRSPNEKREAHGTEPWSFARSVWKHYSRWHPPRHDLRGVGGC